MWGYKIIFTIFIKPEIISFLVSWVYSTNHKRIAVNYFFFVIMSGSVGLILATSMRFEFAYPGVGAFAGDSLQYLTIASAHGVIMVFFMIIPLLFGAYANFLLPTQLGVHDVAFPRLNSAAFWFLPGGLLMLAQMICLDRRFQRMNAFNMRELQSLLKQSFFLPLLSSDLLNEGVLFQSTTLNFLHFLRNSDTYSYLNYLTHPVSSVRTLPWEGKSITHVGAIGECDDLLGFYETFVFGSSYLLHYYLGEYRISA